MSDRDWGWSDSIEKIKSKHSVAAYIAGMMAADRAIVDAAKAGVRAIPVEDRLAAIEERLALLEYKLDNIGSQPLHAKPKIYPADEQ